MTASQIAFGMGALLFMWLLQRGREAECLRRCTACGSRYGERHHRDCHYRSPDGE